MVVADISGIRYAHTKQDRIGKFFSAADHMQAIEKGETYVSIGPGTLGDSLRAFTPVKGGDGAILGFVMAGSLLDSIETAKKENRNIMLIFLCLGAASGLVGAWYVAGKIKHSLLGYEPEDIARLYIENQGILSTVHEGIIAIDLDGVITLANQRCLELLQLTQQDVNGLKIQEVFPKSKLPDAVISGIPILDYQYALGHVIVVSNNIPLVSEGQVIGGVSSFRDQTEIKQLAEEMTGVRKIVDSLRATTHEFKNKLHVILGFIETERFAEAKGYIALINQKLQQSVTLVLSLIKEPTIAALLIGKFNRSMELDISLILTEDSNFSNEIAIDVNSLVVILGNLIENAMEHLDGIEQPWKSVQVYIKDSRNRLILEVEDNGKGIEDTKVIFEKGFSTKEGNRGYGLYLVKENVEKYGGQIRVEGTKDNGSVFSIQIDKGESCDKSTDCRR